MLEDVSGVGVVIVTHESATTLPACLEALPQAQLAGVIVVDNGSRDGSAAVAAAHGAHVVRQPNLGFGAGCNRGVAALPAGVQAVLFLNPDAVLRAPDLRRLARHLREHPRCSVVGPRVRSQGALTYSAGRLASLSTELRPLLPAPLSLLGPRRRVVPGRESTGHVGYVEGACFLVRRRTFVELDGFDEGYFLFFEELDLAQRVRRSGSQVHLLVDAEVEHVIGASRVAAPFGGSAHLVASEVRYLRRWCGERAARTWVLAMRASLRLRSMTGRVDPAQARACSAAAAAALHQDLKHEGLAARG